MTLQLRLRLRTGYGQGVESRWTAVFLQTLKNDRRAIQLLKLILCYSLLQPITCIYLIYLAEDSRSDQRVVPRQEKFIHG